MFVMEASQSGSSIIESWRSGIRVAAGSERRLNSGFYSRGCRERFIYPSPRNRPDEFKLWLISLLARRRIEMLFPVGHYGALAVSEIQEEIRRYTRLVMPDARAFRQGYEKIPTMKAALAAGVPIPDSWFPADEPGGLDATLSKITRWPVLVKPSVGVGARGISWCYSPDEVRLYWPRLVQEYGECYLQDFVPPGGMQYKVDMLVDERRTRLAAIVYGKTRMYPPEGGSTLISRPAGVLINRANALA